MSVTQWCLVWLVLLGHLTYWAVQAYEFSCYTCTYAENDVTSKVLSQVIIVSSVGEPVQDRARARRAAGDRVPPSQQRLQSVSTSRDINSALVQSINSYSERIERDPKCLDPFGYGPENGIIQGKCKSCLKLSITDETGAQAFGRVCSRKEEGEDTCSAMDSRGNHVNICNCSGELCNGASVLASSHIRLSVITASVLIVRLITS